MSIRNRLLASSRVPSSLRRSPVPPTRLVQRCLYRGCVTSCTRARSTSCTRARSLVSAVDVAALFMVILPLSRESSCRAWGPAAPNLSVQHRALQTNHDSPCYEVSLIVEKQLNTNRVMPLKGSCRQKTHSRRFRKPPFPYVPDSFHIFNHSSLYEAVLSSGDNPPKVEDLDDIHFLVAAQKEFTCTEAARSSPEEEDAPAHDAFTRLLQRRPPTRPWRGSSEEPLEEERSEDTGRESHVPCVGSTRKTARPRTSTFVR